MVFRVVAPIRNKVASTVLIASTVLVASTVLIISMGAVAPCVAADEGTQSQTRSRAQSQIQSQSQTQTQSQKSETQDAEPEPMGVAETPAAAAKTDFPNQKSHSHPAGGLCFLEVLQAISGKKCAAKTVEMLHDVVEISREDDRIVVVRIDSTSTAYPRGTEYGDSIFESLDEAEQKIASKLGPSGGSLIHNLHKISLQGKHVQFIRTGPETLVLKVPQGKHYIPVTVKQVELGAINMDLDLKDGYPRLRNIEGVRAVVKTPGVDLPIDLREFARRKDKKGNTHLTFGVKSWIPAPVRFLFGLPEVLPFHYMVRKKPDDGGNNGSGGGNKGSGGGNQGSADKDGGSDKRNQDAGE